jgi:PLP dependent protein
MNPPGDLPDPVVAAPPTDSGAVAARIATLRGRMAEAARRAGRSPSTVTLVAVSKAFGTDLIRAARAAGQADFGEARAQELERKARELGPGIRWHFVGRLQRNKVKDVVGVASLVHSVDRLQLAEAIAARAGRMNRLQRVLVQVNVGADPDKAGCAPEDAATFVAKVRGLEWIACEGLMTIPPLGVDPRPVFATLRKLRDEIRERFPEVQHLSMGMTHDFEAAIEEGATIVRVGEAIFGPRGSEGPAGAGSLG